MAKSTCPPAVRPLLGTYRCSTGGQFRAEWRQATGFGLYKLPVLPETLPHQNDPAAFARAVGFQSFTKLAP